MMSDEKFGDSGKLEMRNDIMQAVDLSRSEFSSVFDKFQGDLYREELSEEGAIKKLEDALLNVRNGIDISHMPEVSRFEIKTIRFRKKGDIERSLKLFYQSVYQLNTPIVFVLKKELGVVTLSLGVVNKSSVAKGYPTVFKQDIESIPGILSGFLPGVECGPVKADELMDVAHERSYLHRRAVVGVPGLRKCVDEKKTQQSQDEQSVGEFGIERVVDSIEDDFIIVGISCPVVDALIKENKHIFADAHDFFQMLAKHTEQLSKSFAEGDTDQETTVESTTKHDEGKSKTSHSGDAIGTSLKKMFKRWWGSEGWGRGENNPTSRTDETINQAGDDHTKSSSITTGHTRTQTEQRGVTVERTNELAKLAVELIDKQMQRFKRGEASGMWRHTTQVLAKTDLTATRVANILCGYLEGEDIASSRVRSIRLTDEPQNLLPVLDLGLTHIKCFDNALGDEYSGVSTLITSDELAKICAFPVHELPGVVVEKLTDFGRNLSSNSEAQSVKIGNVIDHEYETKQEVWIGYEQLKRHMFVTGATGAGKSTTMRQLLLNLYRPGADEHIPFLVIEPVKREYRELKELIPDLEVIPLGDDKNCKYSLAPFAVEQELGLIPHIDNLKAAFNASMGNYSSMPFILEDIIYKAYEECGWDLSAGKNKFNEAGIAIAQDVPKMGDLLPFVETSIHDFFGDKQSDYGNSLFGALRARIRSMTRGAKGNVLDKIDNAIDMAMLLKKPCVIELWPFTDNEEKAFIMAIIMIKLYEYRQKIDILRKQNKDFDHEKKNTDRPLEHVLVIEEAHRLLAKQQSAGEHSSSGRQKAVEFFADILAEIRSYGQGIVIVDQIPSKLIPDVLKNTDVKIAHRLADREDREVIGGTMNLTKEQIGEVSRLKPGEGIAYYGGLRQAVKIKVPLESNVETEMKDREEAKKFHD